MAEEVYSKLTEGRPEFIIIKREVLVNILSQDRGEADEGEETLDFLDIMPGRGDGWAVIELTGDTNPSHGQVRRFKGSRLIISSRWSGSVTST